MAHKIAIGLVCVLYALHIMSAVCEVSEQEGVGEDNATEDEDYEDFFKPVTCYFANSTVGPLRPPNCTVVCTNNTAWWNDTKSDGGHCYSEYRPEKRTHSREIYNCTIGVCGNGTCIANHTYADCW
uniref:Evasin P672 n=1 Tax=Rhipicephalus pulchellus TaxID=72859 RepID=EV672_RHIPC|nr:RecName: Full=Evasin P672; Flags: Precursor [Rhipicephalus pulchellus]